MADRPVERTSTRPARPARPAPGRDRDDTAVRPAPAPSGRPSAPPAGAAQPAAPAQPGAKEARKPVARPGGKGPKPAPAAKPARAPGRPGRRARLRLTRIDPWSVMKTAFLLSIAFAVVTIVSVTMVWSVLGAADVWSSINQTVQDIIGGEDAASFDIEDYVGTSRVVGFTMIVSAVNVILLTAIATLGAFLYNMAASLLGGIEVTLAEDA